MQRHATPHNRPGAVLDPPAPYNHNLPRAAQHRLRCTFDVEVAEELRHTAARLRLNPHQVILDAIEHQTWSWHNQSLRGVEPVRGQIVRKPAGMHFPRVSAPPAPLRLYFKRDRVFVTLRGDPELFDDWLSATHYLGVYDDLHEVLSEAIQLQLIRLANV